jgi:hypothetical protein
MAVIGLWAVENIKPVLFKRKKTPHENRFSCGPPLGESLLLRALAQFFSLSGRLFPGMRHCRSCSLVAADGNGDLHMIKAVERHTKKTKLFQKSRGVGQGRRMTNEEWVHGEEGCSRG